MSSADTKSRRSRKSIRPTKIRQTERERFVSWLNQRQQPNQVLLKKGNSKQYLGAPMLPTQAALLLAVYDGILPASPAIKLQIALLELPRHPRKGPTSTWPVSDA